jgi:hypothetical protein
MQVILNTGEECKTCECWVHTDNVGRTACIQCNAAHEPGAAVTQFASNFSQLTGQACCTEPPSSQMQMLNAACPAAARTKEHKRHLQPDSPNYAVQSYVG